MEKEKNQNEEKQNVDDEGNKKSRINHIVISIVLPYKQRVNYYNFFFQFKRCLQQTIQFFMEKKQPFYEKTTYMIEIYIFSCSIRKKLTNCVFALHLTTL